MTKHQIINLLVDYYHYNKKNVPISISNNWSPNPVKQGMVEMFTKESLVRILRKEIGDKRIQAVKNYKDLISNTTCQILTNNEMLKMAKIEIDKILKPKSKPIRLTGQFRDYDGDCNYCDDNNCTNGECKEAII